MSKHISFEQVKQKYFKILGQYIPIVVRVHGKNHPELLDVLTLFEAIAANVRDSGNKKPDLHEELLTLRETTHDYLIPQDACESFEAVYRMLAEIDEAYHQ